jgi:hypothetical protein
MHLRTLLLVFSCLLGLGLKHASAQQCFPPPARIAICNFECSSNFCGWEIPLLGKRSVGSFITYNTKGDPKPIVIPPGQNEATDYWRLYITSANASLHVYIDEQPDFSWEVIVNQQNGPFQFVSDGNANETFTLDDIPQGTFIVSVIHRLADPGGNTANYVPTIYVVPTVKPDLAGSDPQHAHNIGTVSANPLTIDSFLERVFERALDGTQTGKFTVQNDVDWLQFDAPSDGVLKVVFTPTAILDSVDVPMSVQYSGGQTIPTLPIPAEGIPVSKGSNNYIIVQASPGITDEYGYSYHLEATFSPK